MNRQVDHVVTTMSQATWLMNQHRNGRFIIDIIPSTQNISLCGGVSERNWILANILFETADSTGTNLLSIVQANIALRSDFATSLQRMSPESMLICAALLLTGVCGSAFLIIRNICQQDAMSRFVARYSGDEFLMIVKNRKLTADDALVREVMASCNQPIPLKELMQTETILPGDKIESLVTYLGVGIAVSDGKSSFRRLVQNAGYVDYLLQLMEKNHIPSLLIKLEFTESMFFNNNHVSQQLLKKLQDADISLSLDDFGTGYSSLKYLTYILVDYLKLDKSIIDSYLTEEAEAEGKDRFIRDIISLAHDLGKKIVVEGVETAWQAKRLKSFGCDIIQGYYYSRPISPEEIATFTVRTED